MQRQETRIRNLGDLGDHFPWVDLGMGRGSLARTEIRSPLAVAVRAVKVLEYTVATVGELSPEGDADGMALLGFSAALHSLAAHDEWDSVGLLLNALEALIPPHDRRNWLDGLDPYVAPGQLP